MPASCGQIPVADLAFDGQSGLDPFILAAFGIVLDRLKAARRLARTLA